MSAILEHDYEAAPGLPQALPGGERMLWQGAPTPGSLVKKTFHVPKLAVYFAALLLLRLVFQVNDGVTIANAVAGSTGLFALALLTLSILIFYAGLVARSTLYTITNRRIVIRCGIAVPMTMNLPFSRIDAADLRQHGDGSGDLAIIPEASSRASYLLLWPLVKPWRLIRVRPVLRGVPDASRVAGVLVDALAAFAEEAQNVSHAGKATQTSTADESVGEPAPLRPRRWRAYPTIPLAAAASLVVLSLISVGWSQISGRPVDVAQPQSVVASIDLFFEDRDDGSVLVVDAASGETIEVLEPGTNGFLRGTMRSAVRGRRAIGAGSETPFSLRLADDGRLVLHDPATGRDIDLWAFGKTNAQAFGRFLPRDDKQAVASTAIESVPTPAAVTTIASANQEAKQ